MQNGESQAGECCLADLPVGVPARILGIAGPDADRLAALGFRRGPTLVVEGDAPFRGPRIVRLGTARIALARAVVAGVRVRPQTEAVTTRR